MLMRTRVRAGKRAARRCEVEAPLAYALQSQQAVGEFAQIGRGPAENQHLEAFPAIEVDVRRGDDLGVSFVLDVHQAVGKIRLVMAVDIGQHADGGTGLEFGFSQPVAH